MPGDKEPLDGVRVIDGPQGRIEDEHRGRIARERCSPPTRSRPTPGRPSIVRATLSRRHSMVWSKIGTRRSRGEWEERFELRFGFWRGFVDGAIARYLDCGILENGFARVRCGDCRKDMLVAFSCKGRGLCPSCGAKRAAQTAARLREEIFEPAGHAQWVLARTTWNAVMIFAFIVRYGQPNRRRVIKP